MSERRDRPERTTTRAETIPVLTRGEVLRDLGKAAKAPDPSAARDDEGVAPQE